MLHQRSWIAIIIFLVVFYSHGLSKVIASSDSRWSIFVAESILQDGDIELGEYEEHLVKAKHYCIFVQDGKSYNLFPMGTSVLALPFVAAFDFAPKELLRILPGFKNFKKEKLNSNIPASIAARLPLERLIASALVALSASFIFLIARKDLSLPTSLLLTFIYAFCTSAWSTASRGLWQHGPSILMLSITLYLLIYAKDKRFLASLAGFTLAFSYLVRPTNCISICVLSLYVFLNHRKSFPIFFLCMLLVLLPSCFNDAVDTKK